MTWNIPVLFILGNFCMTTIKPCFQIVSVPFQIWLWKLLSVMWNSSMVSSFVHLILSFPLRAQDSPISYLSKCSLILWNMKMQSFKSQGIKALQYLCHLIYYTFFHLLHNIKWTNAENYSVQNGFAKSPLPPKLNPNNMSP